jgi:anaerobic nitric oxide reductase transcription regulator
MGAALSTHKVGFLIDFPKTVPKNFTVITVEHNNGNWAAAARELGINRSNLHKLSKRLGIKDSP